MRATEVPEKWQEVLKAVNREDYELARTLAVKYGFTKNSERQIVYAEVRLEPIKGDYVAQSPDGKLYCHKSARALSRYLGMSGTYVSNVVSRTDKPIPRGKMKGWKFWIELGQ